MGDCIVTYCTAQWKQFFIYLFFIYTSICTAKQNILPAHVIKHIHVAGQFVGVQFGLFSHAQCVNYTVARVPIGPFPCRVSNVPCSQTHLIQLKCLIISSGAKNGVLPAGKTRQSAQIRIFP